MTKYLTQQEYHEQIIKYQYINKNTLYNMNVKVVTLNLIQTRLLRIAKNVVKKYVTIVRI
jgi:hypothetical protein